LKLYLFKPPFIIYNNYYNYLEYRLISKKGEGTFSEVLQA